MKLTLTQETVDRYCAEYFKKHPRARKKPIEHPYHPSINVWCILPRIQMNALKQKWKDFVVWWMNDLGYNNMKLDEFEMIFTTFMPTKRRSDPDNFSPKYILDGMSEAEFIIDDDGSHLKALTLKTSYDKCKPRTEIEIKILK